MSGNARLAVLVVVAVTLAVTLGAQRLWMALNEAPPRDGTPAREIRVEPGEGFASVADRLAGEGLVVSARRFRILARLLGVDRDVQAGTYRFARGVAPRALLDDLVHGRVHALRLVIPEGWRMERIGREVEKVLDIPLAEFREAVADSARRARLGDVDTLEGYLYPDTYFFAMDVDAATVVDAMLSRFESVWASLQGEMPQGWNRHDVVTLASIVVAETALTEEKPRVAAVYLNRLREGWRLQADPTVRYGLGRFTGRLYFKHLSVDTPYNTYRNGGLPPGPVASPGRESLQAVLKPLAPCDEFFFVASGDGGHIFSRTKAEHDRARRRVRETAGDG